MNDEWINKKKMFIPKIKKAYLPAKISLKKIIICPRHLLKKVVHFKN